MRGTVCARAVFVKKIGSVSHVAYPKKKSFNKNAVIYFNS